MVITVFPCKNTADRKNVKCHLCFQSEGLTAAFRKFFRTSKIRVFRLHSLTSHLSYLPFVRSGNLARKNGSPDQEAHKSFTKGKKN